MRKSVLQGMMVLLAGTSIGICGTDTLPAPDISLWGRFTLGQVRSTSTEAGFDYPFDDEWLENIDGGLRLTRQVSPNLLGRLHVGFRVDASTVKQRNFTTVEFTAKKFTTVLLDASLQYTRKDLFLDSDLFQLDFGYFPFKYNPQSTNLGEYLFRSNTYPGVIVSGFEHSIDKPKVGGIHFAYTCDAFGKLKQDLLLTSELDIYPLRDLNLTYMATYTPHPIFTLGAGVMGQRLIVLDSVKTTPGLDTMFRNSVDMWVGYIDPITNDTTRYTFQGTKIMARAMLDIKELIELGTGKLDFLGTEDLKLYGEAAILGVKDYPGWYDKLSERIPVMTGFNWPTHQFLSYCIVPGILGYSLGDRDQVPVILGKHISGKEKAALTFGTVGLAFGIGSWLIDKMINTNSRLDQLSFEGEYYPTPYWNSQENIWKAHSPVPYVGTSAGMSYAGWNDSLAKTDDDIKWSVYASKKIGSVLRISAQVASDHTPRNWYTPGPPSFVKYTDVVPRTKDWYYMMRVSFYF